MKMSIPWISLFGALSLLDASAQTPVGAIVPETVGFTQAPPSAPLQNLTEFSFENREGEVLLVVYHASW